MGKSNSQCKDKHLSKCHSQNNRSLTCKMVVKAVTCNPTEDKGGSLCVALALRRRNNSNMVYERRYEQEISFPFLPKQQSQKKR